MGKYSCCVDGKVLDWKFTKCKASYNSPVWNFHLGGTFIGKIFKGTFRGWNPVVYHTRCPFGGLNGFATRYDAAEYMLKVCGFMQGEFETYSDLIGAKRKLEAAEAKVESLQGRLSWIDNPERMGG
jgi:hypothetical protein